MLANISNTFSPYKQIYLKAALMETNWIIFLTCSSVCVIFFSDIFSLKQDHALQQVQSNDF